MSKSHARRTDPNLPSTAIIRTPHCDKVGKIGFATRDGAKQARKNMKSRGVSVKELHPYICQHCGAFHLGTKRVLGEVIERAHHQAMAKHL